jgi:predicted RNA-binding protein with RPS1 domain
MTTDPQQPEPPSIPPAASPDGVSVPIAAENSPSPEVAEQKVPTTPADPVSALPESTNTTDVVAATSVVIDTAHPPVDVLQAETSGISAEAEAAMRSQSGAITRVREKMASTSEPTAEQQQDQATPQAPTSHKSAAVEIPKVDELEASVEAEISAALSDNAGAMPEAVIVPGGESSDDGDKKTVVQGTKVRGTVQAIHGGEVFLDAGLRHNVVLSLTQFPDDKHPNVGDQLDVIIDAKDSDGLIKGRIPRGRHRSGGNWDSLAVGQVVDCLVSAVNKGGLQVTVSNLRAFLPASQVEIGFAGNLEGYIGQKLTVQVTEVNAKKRNLVVSRRALLQAERAEGEGEFWAKVEVGQDHSGTVKTLKDYGAFVNIGPVDGFLHIGEISWTRINHPKDVLTEGQTVDVKILKLDPEKKRISLGMKQLAQNPWTSAGETYAAERVVPGTVTRITEFGAFVELEPGLEGMVHISELAWRRVGSVGEVLKVGETHDFQVVEVDTKRKRVSLSLKALEKRPEPPQSERSHTAEPEAPSEPRRPRHENLRGGTGTSGSGGGMFGNPSDFTG